MCSMLGVQALIVVRHLMPSAVYASQGILMLHCSAAGSNALPEVGRHVICVNPSFLGAATADQPTAADPAVALGLCCIKTFCII